MAREILPKIPNETLEKLRSLIRASTWKTASSPKYRTTPHSYIIAYWYPLRSDGKPTEWKWFSDLIRAHGEYRTWKGYRYKYLIIDGEAFWVDFPALNRAKADTLDEVKRQPKVKPG